MLEVFPHARFNDKGRYLTEEELVSFLEDAEGAIIGRDRIDAGIVKRLPRLKIIAKYGVGLDTINQADLESCGVAFKWDAGVNRQSVAELTLGFMIGLMHNMYSTGFDLKAGVWRKDGGRQLQGKTVGIVGCGHVGERLIELLAPFSCRILICDIVSKDAVCKRWGAEQIDLNRLASESDIVTLHVPLTELTLGMVDANFLNRMKPTAYLINTCRGEVVDAAALKRALMDSGIAGAALDVFDPEPPVDNEFLNLKHFTGTPHIGGNAEEAVLAMGRAPIQRLIDFFKP